MRARKLPKIAEVILSRLIEKDEREFMIGDLKEIYRERSQIDGRVRADCWLGRQIVRSIPFFVCNLFFWRVTMFKNYFKLALRNMRRHWGYSGINIFGLAIGIFCCILTFLWVQDELSFNTFHEKAEDIYLITVSSERGTWASSPWALVPTLKKDFPEIIKATWYGEAPLLMGYDTYAYFENAAVVDQEFFEMFSFPFVLGSPDHALSNPQSVVLTQKIAKKYFGSADPLGKTVKYQNSIDLVVTGVLQDVPPNSDMQFDLLVSPILFVGEKRMLTWSMDVSAYVLLSDQADADLVDSKISGTIIKYDTRTNHDYRAGLFPLRKLHLYSFAGTDPILYIYVFTAIALIVLFIACINFMNLTTARSSVRINEIGVRKVLGGVRRDLIIQFLGESLGLALIALFFAVFMVYLLLPGFNTLAQKQLEFGLLSDPVIMCGLIIFGLFTGITAGMYPAAHFSSLQMQRVLKSKNQTGSSRNGLRKALIISQFTASILLIIATATIYHQIQFIHSTDLGFDKDQICVISASRQMRQKYALVKEKLLQNPNVLSVTAASSNPLQIGNNNPVYWAGRGPENYVSMNFVCVDYDYFETFGMTIRHGRSFSREYATDKQNYIINEAALKLTGYVDPVGKMFSMWEDEGQIVGVVKDFHATSLHNAIRPIVFVMYQNLPYSNWFIKIKAGQVKKTTDMVKNTVASVVPGFPIQMRFLDDIFQNQYLREERLGRILKYFSIFAIFISSLGLFGLATFMVTRRSKEIAIRKILGASMGKILAILGQEFVFLIILANLFAWPLGFIIMNRWMQNFSYRPGLNIWIYMLAGAISLFLAMLTVSYQSLKTAIANPADSLRHE